MALSWFALTDAHYREERASAPQNHNKHTHQIETDRAGIPFPAERFASNPEPKNTDEREKRDLAAQEASAAWGFWMALFGGFQLIATIFGLYYIKRTLHATLEAVEDTGKATIAMQESNRIAREGMERQLRAYVDATRIVVSDFIAGETPRFMVELSNAGSTPAKDLIVISQPFFFAGGGPLPKVRFSKVIGDGSKLSLAANQPLGHECPLMAPLHPHQPNEINSGKVKVIYAGIVAYRDVFGKRHFTTFKAILDLAVPLQNGFRSMTVCSTGNQAN